MLNKETLKSLGLKATLPRLKIWEILANSNSHLSAEDVYKILLESEDDVGLATVYRVLTQFADAGLLKRHRFLGGQSVFEMNEGEHHDHLVCIECNTILEFSDEELEKRKNYIAKKFDFHITDHNFTIYGLCIKCNKNTKL